MKVLKTDINSCEGVYRYGFRGQESDPETGKEAFQLRLWDSRIGRWLTTDPYGQFASPYLGMGNNPITMVDPDGGYSCPNPPCNDTVDGGSLGEVVINSKGGNKGIDFSQMPNWLSNISATTWDTSYTGNLDQYNQDFGTNYTQGNQYNQYYYQRHYLPEQHDLYASMDAATGAAANMIMEGALLAVPLPKLGLASKIIGNTSIPIYRTFGGVSRAQGYSWGLINPRLYGKYYRNFAGLPNGNTANFMIKGHVKVHNIIKIRSAKPLDGNFGRFVPELIANPSNVLLNGFKILK